MPPLSFRLPRKRIAGTRPLQGTQASDDRLAFAHGPDAGRVPKVGMLLGGPAKTEAQHFSKPGLNSTQLVHIWHWIAFRSTGRKDGKDSD
jgi:hypothetical protein